MFRNLFTVLGIMSVFAVFFFFIRPDWIKQISSTPTSAGPAVAVRVNAKLPADRLAAKDTPKDKNSFLAVDSLPNGDEVHPKMVEDVGDDLPSRSAPYLLVINKSNNTMRFCRLNENVKKVMLRGNMPSEVKLQEVSNIPNTPYQAIIWVPMAIDLLLEFEVMITAPARS